jgi:hypothetical protein
VSLAVRLEARHVGVLMMRDVRNLRPRAVQSLPGDLLDA